MKEKFEYEYSFDESLLDICDSGDVMRVFLRKEGFSVSYLMDDISNIDYQDYERAARERYEEEKHRIAAIYPLLGASDLVHEYDENGEPYFWCDLDPTVFDKPVRITGRNFQEIELRLEMAMDELVASNKAEYHRHSSVLEGFYDERASRDDELYHDFWEYMELAVFGSHEERQYARERLNLMIDYNNYKFEASQNHDSRKALLRRHDSFIPEENAEVFQSFLTNAIEKEKRFTANHLAHEAGFEPSTISRIRKGKIKPLRKTVVRLGIALELSSNDLKTFVHSAGYHFPATKQDIIIIDCLDRGLRGYKYIEEEIDKHFPDDGII